VKKYRVNRLLLTVFLFVLVMDFIIAGGVGHLVAKRYVFEHQVTVICWILMAVITIIFLKVNKK